MTLVIRAICKWSRSFKDQLFPFSNESKMENRKTHNLSLSEKSTKEERFSAFYVALSPICSHLHKHFEPLLCSIWSLSTIKKDEEADKQ